MLNSSSTSPLSSPPQQYHNAHVWMQLWSNGVHWATIPNVISWWINVSLFKRTSLNHGILTCYAALTSSRLNSFTSCLLSLQFVTVQKSRNTLLFTFFFRSQKVITGTTHSQPQWQNLMLSTTPRLIRSSAIVCFKHNYSRLTTREWLVLAIDLLRPNCNKEIRWHFTCNKLHYTTAYTVLLKLKLFFLLNKGRFSFLL